MKFFYFFEKEIIINKSKSGKECYVKQTGIENSKREDIFCLPFLKILLT